MCKLLSLLLFLCFHLFGLADCFSSYDQRQTGDLNVQVKLKNIQLIALLKGGNEEYVDYDYAYDYSEMTIKPQKSTTSKPLNVTNMQPQNNVTTLTPLADNTTEFIVIATDQRINGTEQTATELNINVTGSGINATTEVIADISNQTTNMAVTEYSIPTTTRKVVIEDGSTTVPAEPVSEVNTAQVEPHTNCRRGFAQNHQGKCEYKGHGTSNALRRIVKLAQKIKIGRGYKGT